MKNHILIINTLSYEIIDTNSHGKREKQKAPSSRLGFEQRILEPIHH